MGQIDELWRYDGRRAVVTGCASGIGAHVVRQLTELGAHVVGLDKRPPAFEIGEFHVVDLADSGVHRPGRRIGWRRRSMRCSTSPVSPPVSAIRCWSSRSTSSALRQLTEALIPKMPAGSSIVSVSSLAAAAYREHQEAVAGLLHTAVDAEGIEWCHRHPEALADGGYRLSKEAIILYTMQNAAALGARGIRINCTGPGVTETPILDQLRSRYGQQYLDDIPKPLGRVSRPVRTSGGPGVPEQPSRQLYYGPGSLGRRWQRRRRGRARARGRAGIQWPA